MLWVHSQVFLLLFTIKKLDKVVVKLWFIHRTKYLQKTESVFSHESDKPKLYLLFPIKSMGYVVAQVSGRVRKSLVGLILSITLDD